LENIVNFAKKHSITLASDNPYSHISFNKPHEASILEIPGALNLAIELNSLSKAYNMAGWRIGWVVGNQELAATIGALYSNIETGIFNPIQYAAIKAMQLPQSYITERNEIYKKRLILVNEIAQMLGCEKSETTATLYVWSRLPQQILNAEKFCFDLLEKTGIFVTPGTAFGSNGEGYIRISLCQPEQVLQDAKLILEKYMNH
jgi:LL-diaminopimelate aminotransferase